MPPSTETNIDLVVWAIQYVLGEDGECVVDCLNGTFELGPVITWITRMTARATIKIDDGDAISSRASPWSGILGPYITLGRASKYFFRPFDAFTCWGVVTDEDLECAILSPS